MESDKIRALKLIYKSKLSDKASQLQVFIELLSGSNEQPQAVVNDVGEYLHRLVGSAGMYGYNDIAVSAKYAMTLTYGKGTGRLKESLLELHDLLVQGS